MNQQDQAHCHCIISHPSKPKFLAFQLADGSWSTPGLRYPADGNLISKTRGIPDAVLQHYGLQTTVLRHLFESKFHQCVELEVHSAKNARKMKSVWVGSADYKPMGYFPSGPIDPFANWLKEKDGGTVPENRLDWERSGWFKQASAWVLHELDRQNIQVTGSVQQFRAGWHSSAILRVKTSQDYCYFKAAFPTQPNEAEISLAMARKWPQIVPMPLAANIKRNWILSRNYGLTVDADNASEDISAAARALAEIQVDSLQDIESYKKLGCHSRSLSGLIVFLDQIDSLSEILTRGFTPLTDEEIEQFESAVPGLQEKCERLMQLNVPDMLVHKDFHPRNLYRHDQGYWITDWADAAIAHPFLSFANVVDVFGQPKAHPAYSKIATAYLDGFREFGSVERFAEALPLAAELAELVKLQRLVELLPRLEQESISSQRVDRSVQAACRRILSLPDKLN